MKNLARFVLLVLPAVLWLSSCTTADRPEGAGVSVLPAAAQGEGGYTLASRPMATSGRRFGYDATSDSRIDGLLSRETKWKARSEATPPLSRPGLATTAGYEKWSTVSSSPFFRKPSGQPDAVDSFHYNDEAGAKAMAEALGGATARSGAFEAASGLIKVGLDGADSGRYWPRLEARDRRIVVGQPGRGYSIVLKNETKQRLEVVASVDGLDVMDGGTASVKKRGYVLEPRAELSIDGFRTSPSYVKRFRFGSVGESAAAKKGSVRNVGVIGLAVYQEDAAAARAAQLAEAQKRDGASAFPGR